MLNRRFLPIFVLCIISAGKLYTAADRDPRFPEGFSIAVCTGSCKPEDHQLLAEQNKVMFRQILENPELKDNFFLHSSSNALECSFKQMTEEEISFIEEDRTAFDEEPVSCFPGTRFTFQTIRKNVPWLCSALCCLVGTATVCNSPCCCASCAGIAVVPHVLHKMRKGSIASHSLDELSSAVAKEINHRDLFFQSIQKSCQSIQKR